MQACKATHVQQSKETTADQQLFVYGMELMLHADVHVPGSLYTDTVQSYAACVTCRNSQEGAAGSCTDTSTISIHAPATSLPLPATLAPIVIKPSGFMNTDVDIKTGLCYLRYDHQSGLSSLHLAADL